MITNNIKKTDTSIYWSVNLLMVLTFMSMVLHNIAKTIYIGELMDQIIGWGQNLLTIIVFLYHIYKAQRGQSKKGLYIIYIIYTIYCLYYIYFNPQMPRSAMLGVLTDDSRLIKNIIFLTLQIYSASTILKYFDALFFARVIMICNIIYFPYYFYITDSTYYIINAMNEIAADDFSDLFKDGFIEPFTLAHLTGLGFLCTLYIFRNVGDRKIYHYIIYVFSLMINGYGIIVAGKRGPILMLLITIIVYYYYLAKISSRNLFIFSLVAFFIFLLSGNIVSIFLESDFSAGIIDRILQTEEKGGSGRFGSEDSVYFVALRQIFENPFTGTYFRSVAHSSWTYGYYPHNFFLETLMTFGLIFSIPLYSILWKTLKKMIAFIQNNSPYQLIVLVFFYKLLCYMVSGSIFASSEFWLLLFLLYVVPQSNSEQENNFEII